MSREKRNQRTYSALINYIKFITISQGQKEVGEREGLPVSFSFMRFLFHTESWKGLGSKGGKIALPQHISLRTMGIVSPVVRWR